MSQEKWGVNVRLNGCDNLIMQGSIVFVKYCIVNNVVKQNAMCKYGGWHTSISDACWVTGAADFVPKIWCV